MNATNEPLYVIDGVPMFNLSGEGGQEFDSKGSSEAIADINPEDIESMSVLTGAAAAALYGSHAANGAIVITTKGPWTSSKFDKVCYYIDSDELHLVKKILDGVETSKSQIDIFEYLQSDVAKSWVDVSDKYLNLCR